MLTMAIPDNDVFYLYRTYVYAVRSAITATAEPCVFTSIHTSTPESRNTSILTPQLVSPHHKFRYRDLTKCGPKYCFWCTRKPAAESIRPTRRIDVHATVCHGNE